MTAPGVPQPEPRRNGFPLWWWFLLHGLIVLVWGVFDVVSPPTGLVGWWIDGLAFGIALILAGSVLLVQSLLGVGPRRGAGVFAVGGIWMLLCGVAACILTGLRLPFIEMWTIFGYLVVEGSILLIGSRPHAAYRVWGALLGAPMYLAAVGIAILWLAAPGYDLMDSVFGVFGIFYGITVVTAGLQARHAALEAPAPLP